MSESKTSIAGVLSYVQSTEHRLLAELELAREILDLPAPGGGWTIGQIARHLIQTEQVMYPMWTVVPKLANWPALLRFMDETNVKLWHLMGMRTVEAPSVKLSAAYATEGRFIAPRFLRPAARPTDYARLLAGRRKVRARSLQAIAALDVETLRTLQWSHPELGRLSLLEMFEFLGIHEEHHLPQIERILKSAGVCSAAQDR